MRKKDRGMLFARISLFMVVVSILFSLSSWFKPEPVSASVNMVYNNEPKAVTFEPSYNTLLDMNVTATSSASPNNVWIAGQYRYTTKPCYTHCYGMTFFKPYYQHYNGKEWKTYQSTLSFDSAKINALAQVSEQVVYAAGSTGGQNQSAYIEHWNGSRWVNDTVYQINPGGVFSELFTIQALSPSNIWAVGTYYKYPEGQHALILHYNGKEWRRVAAPDNVTTLTSIQRLGIAERAVAFGTDIHGVVQMVKLTPV